jgi:hypothetical protein
MRQEVQLLDHPVPGLALALQRNPEPPAKGASAPPIRTRGTSAISISSRLDEKESIDRLPGPCQPSSGQTQRYQIQKRPSARRPALTIAGPWFHARAAATPRRSRAHPFASKDPSVDAIAGQTFVGELESAAVDRGRGWFRCFAAAALTSLSGIHAAADQGYSFSQDESAASRLGEARAGLSLRAVGTGRRPHSGAKR